MTQEVYFIISLILIIIGILGIFVPGLPGPILVMVGIFFYSFVTNFTIITIKWIIIFALLTLTTIVLDYISSLISAKKFGVSKLGIAGMIIGGIIGFITLNVIGLLAGQFLGIILGEILSGKNWLASIKSGGAGIIGYILGIAANTIIVGIMVSIFIYKIFWGG